MPFQILFLVDLAYLTCFVISVSAFGNVEVRIFALAFWSSCRCAGDV